MVFSPAKWASAPKSLPRTQLRGLLAVSGLAVSLVVYLVLMGSLSTSGYTIRQLEKTATSLRTEAERLQVESAKLQALNQYVNKAQVSGFVAVDKIEYLSVVSITRDVAVK